MSERVAVSREHKNVLSWIIPATSLSIPTTNAPSLYEQPQSPSSTPTSPSSRKPYVKKEQHPLINIHKRHWNYLFDNLNRAIDELYETCEQDWSVEEAQEVVHTLARYMTDFEKLVEKVKVISEYEEKERKPKSIAWEERKVSPTRKPRTPEGSPLSSTPTSTMRSPNFFLSPGEEYDTERSQNLQKRLNSPERTKKSPSQTKEIQEQRQAKAQQLREQFEAEKKDKARATTFRTKEITEKKEWKRERGKLTLDEKLGRADQLRGAQLQAVKKKAELENLKAEEVGWMTKMINENNRKASEKKLVDAEARRQEILEERKRKMEEKENRRKTLQRRSLPNTPEKPASPEGPLFEEETISTVNTEKHCVRCVNCAIDIPEEFLATHLQGKRHKSAAERSSVSGMISPSESKERKATKKLRDHMNRLSLEFVEPHPIKDSPHKPKLIKIIQDINKYQQYNKNSELIEKSLTELAKLLNPKNTHIEHNQHIMRQFNGIDAVIKLCTLPELTSNVVSCILKVLSLACQQHSTNLLYILMTNKLTMLINLLDKQFDKDNQNVTHLIMLITLLLWQNVDKEPESQMKSLVVSYIVNLGLLKRMKQQFLLLQNPNNFDSSKLTFVEKCIELLEVITAYSFNLKQPVYANSSVNNESNDCIPLIVGELKETECVAVLPTLISLLSNDRLHGFVKNPDRPSDVPENLIGVLFSTLKFLNNIASLNLVFLQEYLSTNDVQTVYLFNYLVSFTTLDLEGASDKLKILNELILLIGYYCLQNQRNQDVLQNEKRPTILERLCGLPFQYFSDIRYKHILFPTLISACFLNESNKKILESEISTEMIQKYIRDCIISAQEDSSDKDPITKIAPRYQLFNRFPYSLCDQAIQFFVSQ